MPPNCTVTFYRVLYCCTFSGVTTDQIMAERRRERSQKKADRIRMIT